MEGRPARGIALVFASGVLVLLLWVAVSLLSLARLQGRAATFAGIRRESVLAAENALSYGAARLAAGTRAPAGAPAVWNRGDDWTLRLGPGEAGTLAQGKPLNPSYSHGEPWEDADGDGRFGPGERWTDADGDGRFTAWTGRMRGGAGIGPRFILQADPLDGKIPVNAGALWGENRCGLIAASAAVNLPDHRDPYVASHNGLAHVLDNLGALVLAPGPRPGTPRVFREDISAGLIRLPCSFLGEDLTSRRPVGGYESLDEISATLRGLGYAPADVAAVLPHLDPGLPDGAPEAGRCAPWLASVGQHEPVPYVPVNLSVASGTVLASLWMHLAMDPNPHSRLFLGATPPNSVFLLDGPRDGWRSSTSSRAGRLFDPFQYFRDPLPLFVYADEAMRLAERVLEMRRAGDLSWTSLYRDWIANAGWIFERDWQDLSAFPVEKNLWVQSKVDLAFRATALDPFPFFGPDAGSLTWATWGIDRFPGPHRWFFSSPVPYRSIRRLDVPFRHERGESLLPNPADPNWPWIHGEVLGLAGFSGGQFLPLGGVLGPCGRFALRGECRSAAAEGIFRAQERLDCTSQEDFGNWTGGAELARRGIRVFDPDPGARHDPRQDAAGAWRYHAATLPEWNLRSVEGPWNGRDDDGDGLVDEADEPVLSGGWANLGPSRIFGGACLARREEGLEGARLGWTFSQDFDGRINNGGAWTPDHHRDFWHQYNERWYRDGRDWIPPGGPGDPIEEGAFARPGKGLLSFPFAFLRDDEPRAFLTAPDTFHGPFRPPLDPPVRPFQAGMGEWSILDSSDPYTSSTRADFSTPFHVSGQVPLRFNSPLDQALYRRTRSSGVSTTSGWLLSFSAEYWAATDSLLDLEGSRFGGTPVPGGDILRIATRRGWNETARRAGTTLELSGHLVDCFQEVLPLPNGRTSIFIPETDCWTHHIVLTVSGWDRGPDWSPLPPPAGPIALRLYVDGQMRIEALLPTIDPMTGNPRALEALDFLTGLSARRVSQLRFHSEALDAARVLELYQGGRFARNGRFLSPVYVCDAETRLRGCQWTGLLPPALAGRDDTIRLYLHLFDTAGAPLPGSPFRTGSSGIATDLAALPSCHAFRYEVQFVCPAQVGTGPYIVKDTAVFESASFFLKRKGSSPRWLTGWTCR